VSGKDLLIRILSVLGLAAVFLVLLGSAHAVPIKPDIRQLLQQPQTRTGDYAPARAGWDGPESARPLAPSALAAKAAVESEAAGLRRTISRVLIPDPRMLGVVLVAILALRLREEKNRPRAHVITIDRGRREQLAA
jgi:hypothetical protein